MTNEVENIFMCFKKYLILHSDIFFNVFWSFFLFLDLKRVLYIHTGIQYFMKCMHDTCLLLACALNFHSLTGAF